MRRVLVISLVLYFILAMAGALVFKLDFQPDRIAGAPLLVIWFLWLADGLTAMTAGLVLAGRLARGTHGGIKAGRTALLSLLGVALGIPPVYIIIELLYKLVLFLQWR